MNETYKHVSACFGIDKKKAQIPVIKEKLFTLLIFSIISTKKENFIAFF